MQTACKQKCLLKYNAVQIITQCLPFSFPLYQKQMAAAQSLHLSLLLGSGDQQLDKDCAAMQNTLSQTNANGQTYRIRKYTASGLECLLSHQPRGTLTFNLCQRYFPAILSAPQAWIAQIPLCQKYPE